MKTFQLASAVTPSSFNTDARTFEVVFYSGATVPRFDWMRNEEYDLRFEVSDTAVDMSRLKAGAPFLRDHAATLEDTIGVVEDAWLQGGKGYARIRMSQKEDAEEIARDIQDGIIRSVSMGAASLEEEVTRNKAGRKLVTVTRWLPMEISAVAIPADMKAQVLSADTPEFFASAARGLIADEIARLRPALVEQVSAAVRLAINSKGR